MKKVSKPDRSSSGRPLKKLFPPQTKLRPSILYMWPGATKANEVLLKPHHYTRRYASGAVIIGIAGDKTEVTVSKAFEKMLGHCDIKRIQRWSETDP